MEKTSIFTAEQLDRLQEQLEAVRKELMGANPELVLEEQIPEAEAECVAEELNGSTVRIEEDNMTAWFYLYPPREGQQYEIDDIMEFLRCRGVANGYQSSNIKAMVKKRVYNREVKIAVGKQPQSGSDGYYEFLFTPTDHRAPAIRKDGSVDYTNMSMLQNIKKGDKIALYHGAVQGESGYNVRGTEIKAKPAKELPPLRGRNITRLEDGSTYIAEIDGKIELIEGRIDIQKVHEIRGDVTLITGKIEFFGDIIIHGNVETGVVIRAGRNIIISGTVEAVTMNAGGDIVLSKGIAGGRKAKLSARGSVFADFIESTSVSAGADVQANIIMSSEVSAEGKVILTGRRGTLIGGYTHGLLGVEAVNIGNEVEVRTIVHAGYESRIYKKYLESIKMEQDTQQKLARTVDEMTKILRSKRRGGENLENESEYRLLELNKIKDECFQLLDSIKTDKEMLKSSMEKGGNAVIRIDGHIYRGTIICIETAQFPLERSTCFMKYSIKNGIIVGQVLIV